MLNKFMMTKIFVSLLISSVFLTSCWNKCKNPDFISVNTNYPSYAYFKPLFDQGEWVFKDSVSGVIDTFYTAISQGKLGDVTDCSDAQRIYSNMISKSIGDTLLYMSLEAPSNIITFYNNSYYFLDNSKNSSIGGTKYISNKEVVNNQEYNDVFVFVDNKDFIYYFSKNAGPIRLVDKLKNKVWVLLNYKKL
jgi:uncharacterized protein YneR